MITSVFALLIAAASAQETVDVGVIHSEDLAVVQPLLYPKTGRTELTMSVGWMPFDALITTPNLQVGFGTHSSEWFGFSGVIGGGYGLENHDYKELSGPRYGVAPDAYRYLGSALFGVDWSPIYAKANINGAKVIHFDIYGSARAGVSFESSVIPKGGFAVAPTISPAIGTRFFMPKGKTALRIELRDDMLIEHRKLTQDTYFKQNVNVMVGYTMFAGGK